jgi:hypothetical protein
VQDGLITVGNRTGSSWHDGIPDTWRLLYFGTVSNISPPPTPTPMATAPNWQEYVAGTNPLDAASVFKFLPGTPRGRGLVHAAMALGGQQKLHRAILLLARRRLDDHRHQPDRQQPGFAVDGHQRLRAAPGSTAPGAVRLLDRQFLFDLEFLDALAQGGARDAQQLGRLHLVALGFQQRLNDQFPLDRGQES